MPAYKGVPNEDMAYSRRRRERHRRVLEFLRYTDVAGKHIVEIGANDTEIASYFRSLGAASVMLTNLDPVFEDSDIDSGIRFRRVDARRLTRELDGPIDLIFGNAILEHLSDIEGVAREMRRAIPRDGYIFLAGQPIWTSSIGHHVWVTIDRTNYRFTEANNPVPPFGHLLYEPAELMEYLTGQKSLSRAHAEAIVENVYYSDHISRAGLKRIVRAFTEAGLPVVEVIRNAENVSPEMTERLVAVAGADEYGVLGATIVSSGAQPDAPAQRTYFAACRLAHERAPDRPEFAQCFAECLARAGDLDAAERLSREAAEADPDHPAFQETLSNILAKRGDTNEAAAVLRRAAERWPADPRLRARLAAVMRQSGSAKIPAA